MIWSFSNPDKHAGEECIQSEVDQVGDSDCNEPKNGKGKQEWGSNYQSGNGKNKDGAHCSKDEDATNDHDNGDGGKQNGKYGTCETESCNGNCSKECEQSSNDRE